MDLLDILRVLQRRWLIALTALGAGIALLIAASTLVEADWDGRTEVLFQGPFQEVIIDDLGQEQEIINNPLLTDGAGSLTLEILWRRVVSQEVKTTFAEAGLSTNYVIDFELRRPFMSIEVTDRDADLVAATLDGVVDFFESELELWQDRANVDDASRVTLVVLSETEFASNLTTRRRAQGVVFVLALAGAVAAATIADTMVRRRDDGDIEENELARAGANESLDMPAPALGDGGVAENGPPPGPDDDRGGSNRWGRRGIEPDSDA